MGSTPVGAGADLPFQGLTAPRRMNSTLHVTRGQSFHSTTVTSAAFSSSLPLPTNCYLFHRPPRDGRLSGPAWPGTEPATYRTYRTIAGALTN
jgi:hypothetical protein